MPADPCAGLIFVDEGLAERVFRPVEQRRDLASQGNEKRRKRRGLDHRATAVVVPKAEANHPAVGEEPLEVERLERQRAKLARERRLFSRRHNIRDVSEPFRQARGRGEQIGLSEGRASRTGGCVHARIDRKSRRASKQRRAKRGEVALGPHPAHRPAHAGRASRLQYNTFELCVISGRVAASCPALVRRGPSRGPWPEPCFLSAPANGVLTKLLKSLRGAGKMAARLKSGRARPAS